MTKCEEVRAKIESVLDIRDIEALESLGGELSDLTSDHGALPRPCFEYLMTLMVDQRFLSLQGSWHLLTVFDLHWCLLTDQQRTHLLSALENAYGRFDDWMACFLATEILGKRYMDSRALGVLVRLKQGGVNPVARSLLPHGFEHLALYASEASVANQALAALQDMREDTSAEVRSEVRDSLLRVQNRRSV